MGLRRGIELWYPDPCGRWSRLPWVYLAHRRWSIAPRSREVTVCATREALVLCERPGVRCIDAESGEERWRDDAARPELAWPALNSTHVFLAHRDAEADHLEALALADGAHVWKRSWPRGAGDPGRTARVVVADDQVVVTRGPDAEGRLQLTSCALADGAERWSQTLEGDVLPAHLVLGEDAVGLTQDAQLRIHALADGALQWWHELDVSPIGHLGFAGETWVCWAANRTLVAFDAAGGVRWRRTFPRLDPDALFHSALRLDDERLQYLDEKRYSLELQTGEEAWKGARPQGATQVIALTADQAYTHPPDEPITAYVWLSSPLLPPASGAACAAINWAGSLDPPPVGPDEGPRLAALRAATQALRTVDLDDDDATAAVRDELVAAVAALPIGRATEQVAERVCEAAVRTAMERGGTALFASGQVADALHEALRTYRWEVAKVERRIGSEPELEPVPDPEPAPEPEPEVPSDIEPIPVEVLDRSPLKSWSPPTDGLPPPLPEPKRDLPLVQIAQAVVCAVFAAGALMWMIYALR